MRVLALGWDVNGPGVERANLPDAESLASYEAVLVDPAPISELWTGHAQLEGDGTWRLHPGRDLGLSRALERLLALRRGELEDLLRQAGGLVAVRVRPPGEGVEIAGSPARRLDCYAFLPRLSLTAAGHHLALPQGIRFSPRRGRDIEHIDLTHPLASCLAALRPLGYEAVITSTLGTPLAAFGQVVARNRVGDALAWDLPVDGGRIVFLPSFPGADPTELGAHLLPGLGALLSAPLAAGGPDWLTRYPLPGEEELAQAEQALAAEEQRLARRREELATAGQDHDALRGLLFPRGLRGLAAAAQAALERVGFSCSRPAGPPETILATAPEGEAVVQVALSLAGPVGPDAHRGLVLALDHLHTEGRRVAKGVLIAVAEPRLDPRRRGPQWSEGVARGCARHGLALTSGYALFRAVAAVLAGTDPAQVRQGLLSTDGEWRWKA
ncbi:MAG: hypothetical protein ACP5G2_05325 [Candidatus Bipolaricaulaceae bacterium]